ncbi:MAG TPA: multicopper oxidase domain-containing protein [Gemmatimonadaceae bacterium]|nr:multicopper oxidase domain-containing protein [Gemmatimonadaceae bacterium]
MDMLTSTFRRTRLPGLALLLALALLPLARRDSSASAPYERQSIAALAVANDNRSPAGSTTNGVLTVLLDARPARWLPDEDVDSTLTVQAFAEQGGAPRIPGPLIRAAQGTTVRVTVINSTGDSTLVLHGLPAGGDSVIVPAGLKRVVEFAAGAPGTYLYWASTTGQRFGNRTGRDAQLTGALIIDPAGVPPDTSERVFVITMMDVLPDTTKPKAQQTNIFDLAVNGKSWPHTERLAYAAGDTVRWRWVNGGQLEHPMHLHGFHFRVLARGSGSVDTTFAADAVPHVVTEQMGTGTTFRMEFVPTREGRWLFHCHIVSHIIPFPERPDSARAHGAHDAQDHVRRSMSGLVLSMDVRAARGARRPEPRTGAAARMRLFAQEVRGDSGKLQRRGFVLARGGDPRRDSVEIPGSPLVLTRGRRAQITVVNRLSEPTSVHWHGMELDAYYDGVAGWSGAGTRRAPLVAPGDSFTVAFTPPRAGTFMYHTHMEEEAQLHYGLFGPMIVLEPGARFDTDRDLFFMIGEVNTAGVPSATINGLRDVPARTLRPGTTYRLRFLNIHRDNRHAIVLRSDSVALRWTPAAKDGADLPPGLRGERASTFTIAVGETYDFFFTPHRVMDAEITVRRLGQTRLLTIPLRVR